jgi:Rv2632c-like
MNDIFHIDVRVVQDDQVTVVAMETEGFGHISGSAKRHPADEHNSVIGQCVAFSRLFGKLADHYNEVTETLIREAEQKGEAVDVDLVEAEWLKQYGIPVAELG